jgi:hypothetical protein
MEIKNNVEIVQESFSAFDCEHYHCLLNETSVLPEFRNKRWVSVESIIKELKCPEVNDMETMDEAYEFLAKRMNKIIDALTSNSKGSPSENSFNKGYEVNQK